MQIDFLNIPVGHIMSYTVCGVKPITLNPAWYSDCLVDSSFVDEISGTIPYIGQYHDCMMFDQILTLSDHF